MRFVRSLLPKTYWTTYGVPSTDQTRFVVWRQWLGRSYDVIDVRVLPEEG